jgi:hypothetical protein
MIISEGFEILKKLAKYVPKNIIRGRTGYRDIGEMENLYKELEKRLKLTAYVLDILRKYLEEPNLLQCYEYDLSMKQSIINDSELAAKEYRVLSNLSFETEKYIKIDRKTFELAHIKVRKLPKHLIKNICNHWKKCGKHFNELEEILDSDIEVHRAKRMEAVLRGSKNCPVSYKKINKNRAEIIEDYKNDKLFESFNLMKYADKKQLLLDNEEDKGKE